MGQTRQEKILLEFETKYGKQGIKQLQSDLFAIKKDLAASQGKIIEFGKKVVLNQKLQQEKVKVAQQKIANSMSDAINKTSNFKDVNTMVTEGIGQYNNRLQTQRLLMQEAINKSSQFTSVQEMVSDAVNDYDYRARQAAATTKLQQEQMYGATITGHKYGKVLIKIHQSQQKMLMSMLGVMFFGMAIRSMFLSLFNPVMEAYGVFELFSAVLLVTFLPVMEILFPILLKLAEFFLNLPQPVQLMIGLFAAFAVVFGTILMVVGQLVIGVGALVAAFVFFGPLLAGIGTALSAMFLPFIIAVGVIIALVAIFRQAFEENFMGIRTFVEMIWNGISNIVIGVINIIKGAWEMLVGLFTGDLSRFINGFKTLSMGIVQIFAGIVEAIAGIFLTIGTMVLKVLDNMVTLGIDIVKAIGEGIMSHGGTWIYEKILSFIPKLSDIKNRILSMFSGGDSGGSSKSSGSSPKKFNDMIWRPGSAPVSISPQDTLVATKGGPAGGGSSVVYNNTNNIQVMDKYELQRMLDDRDRKLLDDLRRLTRGA